MAEVREVTPIRDRIADVCSRYALLSKMEREECDEEVGEAKGLMGSILGDLPVQRCLNIGDALAATALARNILMDFVEEGSASPAPAVQQAFASLARVGMILERAIQGLEDASGESADQYAWQAIRTQIQKTPDA